MSDTWWLKQSQLDDHQKDVLTLSIDENFLVRGPPGSGKTNLLLLRAKQLIGSNRPNVVVVVYNRTLQEFIRAGVRNYGIPEEKVTTFHRLANDLLYRIGASVDLPKHYDTARKMLAEAVRDQIDSGRLRQEYSCVLVDEAQDFLPIEIETLRRIGATFFAGADGRQKIYKGQEALARLERECKPIDLPFHYRNGHKICIVADELALRRPGEPTLLATSKYPEAKMASSVEVIQRPSMDEQFEELLVRLDRQLRAYPDQMIGVACPRNQDVDDVVDRLRASTLESRLTIQTTNEGHEPFEAGKNICVSSLHGSKGLEFRAFNIVAAEGIGDLPLQRELAFMGVTRAKTSLCIYHTDTLPSALEAALAKLQPTNRVPGIADLLEGDEEEA